MSGLYDLTLPAGTTSQQIPALGSLVKVVQAPAGYVTVRIDGGDAVKLLEGQGLRMPAGQQFRDITVSNASGVAQSVLVFIGDSNFEDSRVTGTVRVVDQGSEKTTAGLQFYGNQSAVPAAGRTALAGIKAGARRVAIKRASMVSPTAGTALLYTAAGNPTLGAVLGGGFNSKLTGGAQSLAVTSKGEAAATTPTGVELPGNVNTRSIYLPANTEVDIIKPGETPIILQTAGQGLFACGFAADRTISLVLDFEELLV